MAIDRVTPLNSALTIPERVAREQPGQAQPIPPVAQPHDDTPDFALQSGLPAAVGALLDAAEGLASGRQAATAAAAGLAARMLAGEEPPAAMASNQLFLSRQLVWHPPDTSIMAASWMVMVRTYSEQRAALQRQASGRHVPGSLFLADPIHAVKRESRAAPQLVQEMEAWRFAVYAWGAEKLVLRVVARDPGQQDGPPQQRRRPRIALRLELNLPDFGKIVIQMEPGANGVTLEVGAAQQAAMQHMRTMLPKIASLAARCGIQIVRARLMRELSPVTDMEPTRHQVNLLSPSLFKAMAETAVLLSQPLPPDELFFEPADGERA
ncbi:flagellar hook-length control protein FliK [Massilia endophytica]|uniref:flagellar hook-length control protein FliK n=1 Tax=Massilia endophytica TaxID=2899220 RepID=UPI001E49D4A9|nr:flagellar hook-length control protein FliK [Massilia endophytica]UGQ48951.1 flagellar hook-length control protein FliK [Massilia endophytica]